MCGGELQVFERGPIFCVYSVSESVELHWFRLGSINFSI